MNHSSSLGNHMNICLHPLLLSFHHMPELDQLPIYFDMDLNFKWESFFLVEISKSYSSSLCLQIFNESVPFRKEAPPVTRTYNHISSHGDLPDSWIMVRDAGLFSFPFSTRTQFSSISA